jgi:hypothetical protein
MATTTTAIPGSGQASSDDFSQPIYLDESTGAGGGNAAGDPASAIPVLNLDDPNLLMQEIDCPADKDPYAAPPPLPDGRWLVRIKQRDVKGADGQPARYKVATDKQGQPYAFTALDATVVDASGKWDGISLTDYFVSTRADSRKGGAIPLAWILAQLKVQLPAKITARTLLDEFFKATASEPQLEIDTVWEGSLDQADQERFESAGERQPRVLGQHRFPQDSRGGSLPDMDVDTKLGKVHLHARPRINGYFAVGSAKASGVEYGPKGR